jgi:hypothetical protein
MGYSKQETVRVFLPVNGRAEVDGLRSTSEQIPTVFHQSVNILEDDAVEGPSLRRLGKGCVHDRCSVEKSRLSLYMFTIFT